MSAQCPSPQAHVPPFSPLFLAAHSVPTPGLDMGYHRGHARPGRVLAEPLVGPSRLTAEMGESKGAPAVKEILPEGKDSR